MADKKAAPKASQRLQVADMGTPGAEAAMWPMEHLPREVEPSCIDSWMGTRVYLVLDRSGSMDVVRDATIEGINAFVQRAAASGERAKMTLTTFSTDFEVVVADIDLDRFRPMSRNDYRPSGGTALLDAFARTIALADQVVLRGEADPNNILFVVMTDGAENASRRYTREALSQLIADREDAGYEFLYLGANQDSFDEAGSIGVRHAANWESDEYGTRLNIERARRITSEKMAGRRVDSMSAAEIQPTAEDAEWVAKTIKGRKTSK